MKYWVDVPSGYMFGFPKVWDNEKDPEFEQWLINCGYENLEMADYCRMWEYKDDNEETTGA